MINQSTLQVISCYLSNKTTLSVTCSPLANHVITSITLPLVDHYPNKSGSAVGLIVTNSY